MKLASLKNNTQDGELWVVSRDLYRCAPATDIAPTLQAALDNWRYCFSKLQQRYEDINNELIFGDPFLQQDCASPLPRGRQWLCSLETMDRIDMLESVQAKQPIIGHEQASVDKAFMAPHDPIHLLDPAGAVDFEPEIAVVTGDVPLGVEVARAGEFIRLLMLSNDVLLQSTSCSDDDAQKNVVQSRLPSTFSPVAVTVDELEHFWDDYQIHLPLFSFVNGEVLDHPPMGDDLTADFASLIAYAAKNAPLRAGTIVGSRAKLRSELEQATLPLQQDASDDNIVINDLRSDLLSYGDELRIEMFNPEGMSIFGAIYQVVKHSGS